MAWTQTRDGFGIRHTLVGTSLSVLASGGPIVSGYGAGGRARRAGGDRAFEVYDGEQRILTRWRLKDAKAAAEQRAGAEAH